MKMGIGWVSMAMAAIVFLCGAPAWGGEDEDKARALLEKHKESVVTVKMVIKQKYARAGQESRENESKSEATGTVIGPDGLTVLALSSTDPASLYKKMMAGMMGDMQIDSEVSDVKLLLADGTEIASEIVLRDKDLDLAYARPVEKPESPMPYVDLSASAEPQILDRLVSINRLGKVANRVFSVAFERIEAIVEKPRTFYLPGNDPTSTSQGCPAFTLEGKVVGVFVMRAIMDTGGGRGGGFGAEDSVAAILLPAVDILDGAQQAPAFE